MVRSIEAMGSSSGACGLTIFSIASDMCLCCAVVFGRMMEGMPLVRSIEAMGSSSGDCGLTIFSIASDMCL